jgi:UDP-xylose/UDP-N-acetylglucosamine transporter B4
MILLMIFLHRYTLTHIISVIIVTLGVVTTTLSASRPNLKSSIPSDPSHSSPPIYFTASYVMGIIILSIALIFAGLLGLVQDWTFSQYRRLSDSTKNPRSSNGHAVHSHGSPGPKAEQNDEIPKWQESMFYLHFLAMPLFLFVWKDLIDQFRSVHSGPRIYIPLSLTALYRLSSSLPSPLAYYAPKEMPTSSSLSIPTAYFSLFLNTLTQLLCASGVHRLTGRVSSLTVTLTLVVRKAVSLVISVLLYGGDGKGNVKMWVGAVLVLAGTVGYSMGGMKGPRTISKQVVAVGSRKESQESKEKAA